MFQEPPVRFSRAARTRCLHRRAARREEHGNREGGGPNSIPEPSKDIGSRAGERGPCTHPKEAAACSRSSYEVDALAQQDVAFFLVDRSLTAGVVRRRLAAKRPWTRILECRCLSDSGNLRQSPARIPRQIHPVFENRHRKPQRDAYAAPVCREGPRCGSSAVFAP